MHDIQDLPAIHTALAMALSAQAQNIVLGAPGVASLYVGMLLCYAAWVVTQRTDNCLDASQFRSIHHPKRTSPGAGC